MDAYLGNRCAVDKYNLQKPDLRLFFDQHRDEAPLLQKYAQRIHMHRDIIGQIEGTIDRSGEILLDNASPELRQVFRIKIRTMESDHKKALVKIRSNMQIICRMVLSHCGTDGRCWAFNPIM
ncbi:MAG: hypothetical protein R3C41_11645 [Calditrichia bacterium]